MKNTKQKANKIKPKIDVKIGQTLETNDIYLPHEKKDKPKSKSRPAIVVDKNSKQELVIVPGSTKNTPNTTEYKKYGIQYYRHNIEIEDNEQKPIKVNQKFRITKNSTKLPESEAIKIRTKVIEHSKFSSENRKKYNKFWKRKK